MNPTMDLSLNCSPVSQSSFTTSTKSGQYSTHSGSPRPCQSPPDVNHFPPCQFLHGDRVTKTTGDFSQLGLRLSDMSCLPSIDFSHNIPALNPPSIHPNSCMERSLPMKAKTASTSHKESRSTKPYNRSAARPPYSYIGLASLAILLSPAQRLTLSDIRDALTKMFSYFRGKNTSWKTSLRSSLSKTPCFYSDGKTIRGNNYVQYWKVDTSRLPHHAFIRTSNDAATALKYKQSLLEELSVPSILHDLPDQIPSSGNVPSGLNCSDHAQKTTPTDCIRSHAPELCVSAILDMPLTSGITDCLVSIDPSRHSEVPDVAQDTTLGGIEPCRSSCGLQTSVGSKLSNDRDNSPVTIPCPTPVDAFGNFFQDRNQCTSETATSVHDSYPRCFSGVSPRLDNAYYYPANFRQNHHQHPNQQLQHPACYSYSQNAAYSVPGSAYPL